MPRSSMRNGAKIVGVRWVDTDKGGPGCPKVRSRLVAQDLLMYLILQGNYLLPRLHWQRRGGLSPEPHHEVGMALVTGG